MYLELSIFQNELMLNVITIAKDSSRKFKIRISQSMDVHV